MPDTARQVQPFFSGGTKPVGGIEVILPIFIDDANQSIWFGVRIGELLVCLVKLEVALVAFIPNANELPCPSNSSQSGFRGWANVGIGLWRSSHRTLQV